MANIVSFEEHNAFGVQALIGTVFAEYQLTFEPKDYDSDLSRIPAACQGSGGAFWVIEEHGHVVGTTGVVPLSSGEAEIRRVYIHPAWRGRG